MPVSAWIAEVVQHGDTLKGNFVEFTNSLFEYFCIVNAPNF